MRPFAFVLQSASEQVASFIRDSIERRIFVTEVPGIHRLAAELNVNHKTVTKALGLLEEEGVLVSQGRGKPRRIVGPESRGQASLRVGILCLESTDPGLDPLIDIQHLLMKAGHVPVFPEKTLSDLGMDVGRVARFVNTVEADAWIVVAASREVLEWFSVQKTPAFALFGRRQNVEIAGAGPITVPALMTIVQRLVNLGHRRVVMLSREMRRLPKPAEFEKTFLDELENHGISVGPYHLPAWKESRDGFQELLESLFKLTPPTAFILHEAHQVVTVLQFFAKKGTRIPEDVSLVCLDSDFSFRWCKPAIAHISWDVRKAAGCVEKWVNGLSAGRADRRQVGIQTEFFEGGTIGPVSQRDS